MVYGKTYIFYFFNILINISVSITYILTFIKALAQVQDRLCHVYIIRTLKQMVHLTLSCTAFSSRKNFSILSQLDLSNNWPRDSTTESQVFREHQSADSTSSFEQLTRTLIDFHVNLKRRGILHQRVCPY